MLLLLHGGIVFEAQGVGKSSEARHANCQRWTVETAAAVMVRCGRRHFVSG